MRRGRGRHPRRPEQRSSGYALTVDCDAVLVNLADPRAGPDFDAQRAQDPLRARTGGGEHRERPRGRLHQDDPGDCGIDGAILVVEASPGELGDRAGKLDACGSAADNDDSAGPADGASTKLRVCIIATNWCTKIA